MVENQVPTMKTGDITIGENYINLIALDMSITKTPKYHFTHAQTIFCLCFSWAL